MAAKIELEQVADTSDWDRRVWACPDANIYCASPWGTYKARRGLEVYRTAIRAGGQDLALAQWTVRRKGPARFIHVQGGPLLTEAGARQADAVFATFIGQLGLGRFDLLGVDYHQFERAEAKLALLQHGFAPTIRACDHTLEVDLTRTPDAIRAAMEPGWRRSLRQAERNAELTTHFLGDRTERLAAFDDFTRMFNALRERKNFVTALQPEAYREIAADDEHLLFLDVREKGERILVRIAHLADRRCTDFYVASNQRALATNAARLSVWRLIQWAKASGCAVFDFGGIDPAANRAVFEFKRGLSGDVAQNTPLWLYSTSRTIRRVATPLFALR